MDYWRQSTREGTLSDEEPKPEPWMVACGKEIAFGRDLDLDDDEYAVLAASAIAAHTPKPEDQPIRRGDVVQCVRNGDDPRYGPIVGETRVVTRVSKDGWLHFDTSFFHDPSRFTRIGRAKYMPDGTPVEDNA